VGKTPKGNDVDKFKETKLPIMLIEWKILMLQTPFIIVKR
jgi:hypothetical protein